MSVSQITFRDVFRSQGTFSMKMLKAFDHVIGGFIARCLPQSKRNADLDLSKALNVLIIRPGGIGDAVFLLPVVRSLRSKGHKVHILCERRNADVFLSQEGLCDSVSRYDERLELFEVFKRDYDVVVDTEQWHHLSAIVAALIKSRLSIGFATRPSRARLFDVQIPYSLNEYELKCFVRLFEVFGIPSGLELKGSYQVPDTEAAWVRERFKEGYIVLVLGASLPMKRFSMEQAVFICHEAVGKGDGVVILGGKDVRGLARDVAVRVKDPRLTDLSGRTTLSQGAAVINRARRVITHDSGLFHLASAMGAGSSVVFGPSDLKKWCEPGGCDVIYIPMTCSPCSRFGYAIPTCRGQYPCVRELSIQALMKEGS